MSEWKEVTIGDICTVKRGASPRPIQNFMCKDGMPWVKIADATRSNSRYINSTEEYITEAGVPKSRIVTPGTLIVSNSATPGLPKIMGITGCVHDGWLIIDDFNGVLKEYMYYKFIDIRRVLSNQANGSVFMNLKTDIVKNFPINVPSIDEQKRIVAYLENIDAKIECNQKICDNLEQQAQALFKHWFIDFAPFKDGKFVESELGMIPEGWRVGTLFDIAEVHDSKRKPLSAMQRAKMDKIYPYYGATEQMDSVDSYIFDGRYVLMGEDGSVVRDNGLPYIQYVWGKIWVNNHAHVLSGKDGFTTEMLVPFLTNYNIKGLVTGAVQAKLNQTNMANIKIAIPPINILNECSELFDSIYAKYRQCSQESSRLSTLRDTLLPKLMSGQIKV